MQVRWQVENDPFCQRVLRKHWPDVELHTDIRRKISFEPVDVVAGGFPCQPVSGAGLRRGEEDPRWLWPQMLSVVNKIRPRWVLIENVEGLRTKGLGSVLEGLAERGYDAEWDRLPAAAFGAPHQRRRYFVVAYPSGEGRDPHARIFRAHPSPRGEWQADRSLHAGSVAANSNGQRRQQIASGSHRDEEANGWPQDDHVVAGARKKRLSPADDGGTRTEWGSYRALVERWTGILGRQSPQPLIRRVDDGVPDIVDRLRGLGNSVVPQVAEYVGRQIIEADRLMVRS